MGRPNAESDRQEQREHAQTASRHSAHRGGNASDLALRRQGWSSEFRAIEAPIQESLESGVNGKTVPQIMGEVEARLRAAGRLQAVAELGTIQERGFVAMREIARTAGQIPSGQHNEDRMRRARSWLARSEDVTSGGERFIFLWIAFNAAHGHEVSASEHQAQHRQFSDFLRKLVDRDDQNNIEGIVWDTYSDPIRIIL